MSPRRLEVVMSGELDAGARFIVERPGMVALAALKASGWIGRR